MLTHPPLTNPAMTNAAMMFDQPGRTSRVHHSVVVRRRLSTALVAATACLAVVAALPSMLAGREGVTASTLAIRPADESAAASTTGAAAAAAAYVVQPGETMWSIARRIHGDAHIGDYVDALVSANGGASLQVGQVLTLP